MHYTNLQLNTCEIFICLLRLYSRSIYVQTIWACVCHFKGLKIEEVFVIGNKKEKRNMKSFIYEDLNRGGNGTQLESASWKITYDEQVYWYLPFYKNTRQK